MYILTSPSIHNRTIPITCPVQIFFSHPIKRIHHPYPAPHEGARITGRQHQLGFDGGAGKKRVVAG